MKYSALAVALSFFCLTGCSQQPPAPGATPVSIAPSPALQPTKEVAKEVEEAGLQFKKSREDSVKEQLERLDKEGESIQDAFGNARRRRDWKQVQENAQRLLEVRTEQLELVQSNKMEKSLPRAHNRVARAYLENGQPGAAEEHYLKALHAAHTEERKNYVRSDLFRLYEDTNNWDKAKEIGRQALTATSSKAKKREWTLKLAQLEVKLKNFGDARKMITEVRKELDSQEVTTDVLEQKMTCCEIESDIAWANEDKIAATEVGVRRAELQKKRYEFKLKEAKAKYAR